METSDDSGALTAAAAPFVDDRRSGSAGARGGGWEPISAWRLQNLYGAIVPAVRSIVNSPAGAHPSANLKILQIGGAPNILTRWLRSGDSPIVCEVEFVAAAGDRIAAAPESLDCIVAIDWLPGVAASQRERAVVDLSRVARCGVIFVNPFDSDGAREAARVINDLHRALHGSDHPQLARCLEIGLPDANLVQRWLEQRFPFVHVAGIDDATIWQAAEAVALSRGPAHAATDADIAAAAVYPSTGGVTESAVAFRSIVTASRTAAGVFTMTARVGSSWAAALAVHHALEAAAQRRSLDSLVAAVTTERDREREEFRAALASLASDLRDVDGRAEYLAREIRARDTTIANQHVSLASAEARIAEAQAAEARANEAHAAAAQVAEARAAEAQAADARAAEAQAAAAQAAEASRSAAPEHLVERETAELRRRLAITEHDADAYRRFLGSRAGRVLQRYTRIKNRFRRR